MSTRKNLPAKYNKYIVNPREMTDPPKDKLQMHEIPDWELRRHAINPFCKCDPVVYDMPNGMIIEHQEFTGKKNGKYTNVFNQ